MLALLGLVTTARGIAQLATDFSCVHADGPSQDFLRAATNPHNAEVGRFVYISLGGCNDPRVESQLNLQGIRVRAAERLAHADPCLRQADPIAALVCAPVATLVFWNSAQRLRLSDALSNCQVAVSVNLKSFLPVSV